MIKIGVSRGTFFRSFASILSDRCDEKKESPASAGLFFNGLNENSDKLRSGELDAAMIGWMDLAKNSSDFSVYPFLAVSSSNNSAVVRLCVKENLRSIQSIACGHSSSSDVVFTSIVLREMFGQQPVVKPADGAIDELLKKTDAVLLTGEEAIVNRWEGTVVDIVEHWNELTGLPYVHALFAGAGKEKNNEASAFLKSVSDQIWGDSIASDEVFLQKTQATDKTPQDLYSNIRYLFDDDVRESLGELFKFGFYHGILSDVPDIRLTTAAGE